MVVGRPGGLRPPVPADAVEDVRPDGRRRLEFRESGRLGLDILEIGQKLPAIRAGFDRCFSRVPAILLADRLFEELADQFMGFGAFHGRLLTDASFGQISPHPEPGLEQLGFRRPDGKPEQPGDFLMLESLDVVKKKNLPELVRKRGDAVIQGFAGVPAGIFRDRPAERSLRCLSRGTPFSISGRRLRRWL